MRGAELRPQHFLWEMQGDVALSEPLRRSSLMETSLTGEANLLVCPTLDSANILFNVLKMCGGQGITIGPMLLGARAPVHVLTPSATVRRILNMIALAATSAGRASVAVGRQPSSRSGDEEARLSP